MKLTRTILAVAVLAAVVVSTRAASASSGCPDDPERCIERGAAVTHHAVVSAPVTVATTAPARVAPVATVAHKAPAPAHKSASKSARVATPAPATPGMGMLLKLSNGTGGEVSLFPSKPTEKSSEASWVL